MATRFELVLHGADEARLRAAGEEALDEIDRLEARLSLYRPASEIARANARASTEPIRLTPAVFRLLKQARTLSEQTNGAFDVTIGPLVKCWGFMGGTGVMPVSEEIAKARSKVGMHLVELDEAEHTVRFLRDGVIIDLGAIGKGYAIDCAAEILRDAGVTSGLIHGGTSTTYAIGSPPDMATWKVAIQFPSSETPKKSDLFVMELKDESLSVSAISGRSFEAGGKVYGHVIDPRTGEPVSRAQLSAVILPSATETDALSTALLALGPDGKSMIQQLRPGARIHVM
jgi:thiamine biosynthesis lipoprotein